MTTKDPVDRTTNGPAATTHAGALVPTLGELTIEGIVAETERRKLALEPNSHDEAWDLCERFAEKRSNGEPGLNLHGCKTPENALARVMTGRYLGLPAMASIENIHLIWQKTVGTYVTVMSVKAKLALVYRRKDIIEYIRPGVCNATSATWFAKRRGEGEIEQSVTFTIEEARQAGLLGRGEGNNYDKYPAPMLQWRACGRLIDRIAADILLGIATLEEVEDDNSMAAEIRKVAEEVVERVVGRQTIEEKLEARPEPAAPAARDWPAEAAALKELITKGLGGKDAKAKKQIAAAWEKFKGEAPADIADDVFRHYSTLAGKAKDKPADPAPAAGAPTGTPPAASAPGPAATPPTQAPTTPATQATASPAAAQAPATPAADPGLPCVSCGEFMPRTSQATWVPTANDGKGGWKHPACKAPVPTHDGREPPPDWKPGDTAAPTAAPTTTAAPTPTAAGATVGQWLPVKERGDAYDGPESPEPPIPFGDEGKGS